jgi:hypothetical protein
MTVLLATLLFLPFTAWYAHRVWRAVKTGAADTLGDPVHRTSRPGSFWFLVVQRLFLGLMFAVMFWSFSGGPLPVNVIWMGAGCLAAATAMALVIARCTRGRIESAREPTGSGDQVPSDR